jgi:hypothetical protein
VKIKSLVSIAITAVMAATGTGLTFSASAAGYDQVVEHDCLTNTDKIISVPSGSGTLIRQEVSDLGKERPGIV